MAKVDQPTVTAEEYVSIDCAAETGEVFTAHEFPDTPDDVDSESDDDTPASRVVTSKMAETALDDVINLFQANPSRADKHLIPMWAEMADIRQMSNCSAKQSAMLDLFKM